MENGIELILNLYIFEQFKKGQVRNKDIYC